MNNQEGHSLPKGRKKMVSKLLRLRKRALMKIQKSKRRANRG